MRHHDEIQHLLMLHHGVIRVNAHPHLRGAIDRMVQARHLQRVVPGLVAVPSMLGQVETTLQIVRWWQPGAVLLGRAAIATNWFRAVNVDEVWIATKSRAAGRLPGLHVVPLTIPGPLIVQRGGHQTLTRSAAALWCAAHDDWDPLCLTLRKSRSTPDTLLQAARLAPRSEAVAWRAAATRARGNPWSVSELELHDDLRAGGIIGWEGNPEMCLEGRRLYPDVRFKASRTIVEVDSEAHHSSPRERADGDVRRNLFTSHGWKVLNIAPKDITARPDEVIERIRMVLHRREMTVPPGERLPNVA
ncbi:endonuclease domain-containing protein [Aestuariimicrobium soli]|uniref:endonuclease domain-containing protein n=1 Tax=Aestuariimicrobium soli TaxID=2035834 RepID=UPI003EBF3211